MTMFAKTFLAVLAACTAALAASNPTVEMERNLETKTVPGCGPVEANTRIVGGSEAAPHSYPWQVAIYIDDQFACGGSIISEEWVLTAALCIYRAKTVKVLAGAHNLQLAEPSQFSLLSTQFIVHERFDNVTQANNIALIKLPNRLFWTNEIAPICLPSHSSPELPTGTIVNLSGWGSIANFGDSIDELRDVDVPIDDEAHCKSQYQDLITDGIICTNSYGGKGTCFGDGGGPMNYVAGGKTFIRGISTFVRHGDCDYGYSDRFTRVLHYLRWIEAKSGISIAP